MTGGGHLPVNVAGRPRFKAGERGDVPLARRATLGWGTVSRLGAGGRAAADRAGRDKGRRGPKTKSAGRPAFLVRILSRRVGLRTGNSPKPRSLNWVATAEAAVMHLQTYRDEDRSTRHFDRHHWSIDMVTATASVLLLLGFGCAMVAVWVD